MTTNSSRSMQLQRHGSWCTAIVAALLLPGCMTTDGHGGYPPGQQYPDQPYPGQTYPGQGYPGQSANQLVGTVQGVDNGRLVLSAESTGYSGGYGSGSPVDVYFDQRTQLHYQGQAYPVTGLEPGDRIRIDATQSGGRLWARSIELLQNVRDRQGGNYGSNDLGGAVTFVDPRARVIAFTRGGYSGATAQVHYDERTVVEYRGQTYRPEYLERGDVVRIQARQWGNEWLAERIVVETSARAR